MQLVDRISELNTLFSATQLSAAELKLLSSIAILLLLCLPFGLGGALRVVCLPLLAALAALACLGWLGQPLTLFSLFGLLLITAIGVDYAILMRENIGGPAVSLLGTLLSALTSWLSFGLLLVSDTPAIANFGLAISLGLLFCFHSRALGRHPANAQRGLSQTLGVSPLAVVGASGCWHWPFTPWSTVIGGKRLRLIPIVGQLLVASLAIPAVLLILGRATPLAAHGARDLLAPSVAGALSYGLCLLPCCLGTSSAM